METESMITNLKCTFNDGLELDHRQCPEICLKYKLGTDGRYYFNFEGWTKLLGLDMLHRNYILIFTAERNMGKSVALWEYSMNLRNHLPNTKIGICRTNDIKMKESLSTFISEYGANHEVIKGVIYSCVKDELGRAIKSTLKERGRFVNILNEHNYRSGAGGGFKDYNLIFWDEFNEIGQTREDFYQKWYMLSKTMERFNSPYSWVLIGNKIDANNDIFINFDLETNRDDYERDYVQKVSDSIYYIDIGKKTYRHLKEDSESISDELAKYDETTNAFANEAAFLAGTYHDVINKKRMTNRVRKIYFRVSDLLLELGSFYNEKYGEDTYYLIQVKEHEEDFNIIALNVEGFFNKSVSIDKKDMLNYGDFLMSKIRQKKLYFDSFTTKFYIEKFVIRYNTLFGKR